MFIFNLWTIRNNAMRVSVKVFEFFFKSHSAYCETPYEKKCSISHLKESNNDYLEQEGQGRCSTFTLCHALAPYGILYGKWVLG